ncbi:uncharacterized protein LOC106663595 [Cimex lectularius]|uniref:Uncharacterized protein n=1 Tax=Cimex lectularius TaxID=79782 RepID=A0A8I6RKX0_CIMLE|nr:uncharacterized protein LOC106663595 [Cimex lectularius]
MLSDTTFTSTTGPDIELNKEKNYHFVNRTHNYLPKRDTSLYVASLFILIGLLAFIISLLGRKDKKKPAVKNCNLQLKSCYVTYGSTHLILPKITDPGFFQKRIHCESGKNVSKMRLTKCNNTERNILRTSKIVSISDLWKAKSRQSNNYFIINIIPEEDEMKEENF